MSVSTEETVPSGDVGGLYFLNVHIAVALAGGPRPKVGAGNHKHLMCVLRPLMLTNIEYRTIRKCAG